MKNFLLNFLGKAFSKQGLVMDDQVTWNLNYVQAAAWAKHFGQGPFFVASVELVNGCLTLSDENGVYLKGQYQIPQEFPEKLLKKI